MRRGEYMPQSELMPKGEFNIRQPEKTEKRKGAAKEFADNMIADIQPFIEEAKGASPDDLQLIAENMGTHLSLNYWAPADKDRRELILNSLKTLKLSEPQQDMVRKAVAIMEKTTIVPFKENESPENETDGDDSDGGSGGMEHREAA
ncbi:hypothetical protein KGQ24_03795 [Patescibacteria group bacterium]|nr:hypothetical protein [Patescibacteria group bacterium]